MKHHFNAVIYQTGINWCVDVPPEIIKGLKIEKGYIYIKGTINEFFFRKCLVPVKNRPYRLFVNLEMMKGAKTAIGKTASFVIEQDEKPARTEYEMPGFLKESLEQNDVLEDFNRLTPFRKNEILKYLHLIKSESTRSKNMERLLMQLKNKEKNVRIP